MNSSEVILLIGHGGVPTDAPRGVIEELKRLEAQRNAKGALEMSPREAELDKTIREWPRTPQTDPYQSGLEAIGQRLRQKTGGRVELAYNEFCAPSLEGAVARLAAEGVGRITLVSTMFTRGGIHSEVEIPEIVALLKRKYPQITLNYAWPYDLDLVADFLARQAQKGREAQDARRET